MSLETIVGVEIHVELSTKSKIFCSCSTEFGVEPNANTCPICLGLPGTLPVLNKEAVNFAIKAGKALNCDINMYNRMDRKNYFYPDLPKAYQISQLDLPICKDGYVEFEHDGKVKKVRINRIQMEEDAGKLVHVEDEPVSLIDYNRVGVPLIEIVTEPDLRSPSETVAFLKTLKSILEYTEISDCKMEQGSLRCDANISLRPFGTDILNTRVEIKNINSFKEVQKALEKEEKRQKELYQFNEGHKIIQETRRWDSAKGKTISMRSKEESHDYRYFHDPDFPPVYISKETIDEIEKSLPEMPDKKASRFSTEYGLTFKEIEVLVSEKALATLFEKVVSSGANPKIVSNLLLGELLRLLKEKELEPTDISIDPMYISDLVKVIEEGKISSTVGKEVFVEMFNTNKSPKVIIEEKGLTQISSTDDLIKIIEEIISLNPKSIEDFKSGKPQASGFLMGQVMKASKGKANPKVAKQLLDEALEKLI